MPALSVLLVTKNAMPFVQSAIRQAEALRLEFDAEVVAVDGGSTDGTRELLDAMPGWTVERQREEGLAAARNEALALAKGDLFAFLDADDEWLPGKTVKQLRLLEDEAEVDVVSGLLKKVGPDGDGSLHPAWTPSGCLFRRRAFERVGNFDTALRIACDHEWFMRARKAGLTMRLVEECLLHKNMHGTNLSNRRAEYRAELLRVLRSED